MQGSPTSNFILIEGTGWNAQNSKKPWGHGQVVVNYVDSSHRDRIESGHATSRGHPIFRTVRKTQTAVLG